MQSEIDTQTDTRTKRHNAYNEPFKRMASSEPWQPLKQGNPQTNESLNVKCNVNSKLQCLVIFSSFSFFAVELIRSDTRRLCTLLAHNSIEQLNHDKQQQQQQQQDWGRGGNMRARQRLYSISKQPNWRLTGWPHTALDIKGQVAQEGKIVLSQVWISQIFGRLKIRVRSLFHEVRFFH